jgi:hypothetical protein
MEMISVFMPEQRLFLKGTGLFPFAKNSFRAYPKRGQDSSFALKTSIFPQALRSPVPFSDRLLVTERFEESCPVLEQSPPPV